MTLTRWGDEKPRRQLKWFVIYYPQYTEPVFGYWNEGYVFNGYRTRVQSTPSPESRWCYVPDMDWSKIDD